MQEPEQKIESLSDLKVAFQADEANTAPAQPTYEIIENYDSYEAVAPAGFKFAASGSQSLIAAFRGNGDDHIPVTKRKKLARRDLQERLAHGLEPCSEEGEANA